METNARYLFVGTGVIVIAVAFLYALLWYSKGQGEDELASYTVYFQTQSLAGLQVGTNVTTRGIRIGRVDAITIAPEGHQGVRVDLMVDGNVPITSKMRAVIQRQILTGLATVELMLPDEVLRSGKIGGNLSPGAEIPEGPGELEKIKTSLEETISNLNTTLLGLKEFLSEENRTAMTKTLTNLESISGTLAEKGDAFLKTGAETKALIEDARGLVKTMRSELESVSRTMQSTATHVTQEAAVAARSVRQAMDGLAATAERYERPAQLLQGPGENSLGPGER